MFPVYLNDTEDMLSSKFTTSAPSYEIWGPQSSVDEN
jgi:hypothetical protein